MFGEQIVGAKTSRAGHVGSGGFSPQALSPVSSPLIPHLASTFLRSLRSRPVTALPRYYGRCDSCPSRRVTSCSTAVHPVSGQASLLTVLDLPAIPSPTTCVRSVSPRHVTCRRIESRSHPYGSSPNGNSRLHHSLAGSPRYAGRIVFLIVRTGRSPPVTLHPVSRRRSYLRLRVIVYPKRTFTSPAKHLRSRDRDQRRRSEAERAVAGRTRNGFADRASIAFRFPAMCLRAFEAEEPRTYKTGPPYLAGSTRFLAYQALKGRATTSFPSAPIRR
jgi:hypothetical protein